MTEKNNCGDPRILAVVLRIVILIEKKQGSDTVFLLYKDEE